MSELGHEKEELEESEENNPIEKNLPFLDHLEELRMRIIKILIAFVICTAFAFIFREDIYWILVDPAIKLDVNFIHTKPYDKFMAFLKISLYSGIVMSFPVILFQLVQFVVPALYPKERRWFFGGMVFVVILFFTGCFLAYKILTPMSLQFLIEFDQVKGDKSKEAQLPLAKQDIKSKLQEINAKLTTLQIDQGQLLEKNPNLTDKAVTDIRKSIIEKQSEIMADFLSIEDQNILKNINSKIGKLITNESEILKNLEENGDLAQIEVHKRIHKMLFQMFEKFFYLTQTTDWTLLDNKLDEAIQNQTAVLVDQEKDLDKHIKIYKGLLIIYQDFFNLNDNVTGLKKFAENQIEKNPKSILSMLSISDYFDWIVFFIFIIGVVFQLPLVITLLAKIGMVNSKQLAFFRPYAFVIILVVSAVITPPDVLSQVIVGGPVYLLYEISILLALFVQAKDDELEEETV